MFPSGPCPEFFVAFIEAGNNPPVPVRAGLRLGRNEAALMCRIIARTGNKEIVNRGRTMGEQHTKCMLLNNVPVSICDWHLTVMCGVDMEDVIYPFLGFNSSPARIGVLGGGRGHGWLGRGCR